LGNGVPDRMPAKSQIVIVVVLVLDFFEEEDENDKAR
jgi:hypothetical protein